MDAVSTGDPEVAVGVEKQRVAVESRGAVGTRLWSW